MGWSTKEIKQKNEIIEVAQELGLKQKGKYWCCPNGRGHTGGQDTEYHLQIYQDSQRCYCHRCHFSGSVLDLVKVAKNFPHLKYAMEWLGKRAGLEYNVYDKGKWRPKTAEERNQKKRKRNFSPIPNEIMELGILKKMKESDLKVYLAQWTHVSPYSNISLANRETIASQTGYNVGEVSRARSRLVKLKLMERSIKDVYRTEGKIVGYQPAFRMKSGEEILNEALQIFAEKYKRDS